MKRVNEQYRVYIVIMRRNEAYAFQIKKRCHSDSVIHGLRIAVPTQLNVKLLEIETITNYMRGDDSSFKLCRFNVYNDKTRNIFNKPYTTK